MATLFAESFDCYKTPNDLLGAGRWSTINSFGSLSSNTQFSGQSAIMAAYSAPSYAAFLTGTNEQAVCGSIRFRHIGPLNRGDIGYITFTDGYTDQVGIGFAADGTIKVYVNGTWEANVWLNEFDPSIWNSLQFSLYISRNDLDPLNTPFARGYVQFRLNGRPSEPSRSPQQGLYHAWTSQATGNPWVNGISLGVQSLNSTVLVDDIYLCSGTGDALADWVGDVRAIQQVPASTLVSGFTKEPSSLADNSFAVRDLINDGDATCIYSATATEDRYAMTTPIPAGYRVLCTDYYTAWRGQSPRAAQVGVSANGSPYTTVIPSMTSSASYQYKQSLLDTDPTGVAWTVAHAQAQQMSVKVTA